MKIHEYQAKQLLSKYGVTVPRGYPAFTVDETVEAAEKLGGDLWVVKAQIHAGGRGKGGGVKLARSMAEVKAHAEEILGMQLITHQTGPAGQKVGRVYVEEGRNIEKEFYLGIVLDRETSRVTFMVSTEGGMEIEEVAAKTPEKIIKATVHPLTGLTGFQTRELAFALGLEGKAVRQAGKFMIGLYKAFVENDASLAEINPLVLTAENEIVALDAKMSFDSNGMFRQKALMEFRDLAEEDPAEIEAGKYGLSYINLDGNIGCMVNGAGLAMSTMDIIKHFGGDPANFLDVGGGADEETVSKAFEIITQDEGVKGIFVNIFGGIMRCDVIASGVVGAAKKLGLNVPLVVRLAGTNVDEGKAILAESGLNIISADSMADGARKIIEAVS